VLYVLYLQSICHVACIIYRFKEYYRLYRRHDDSAVRLSRLVPRFFRITRCTAHVFKEEYLFFEVLGIVLGLVWVWRGSVLNLYCTVFSVLPVR